MNACPLSIPSFPVLNVSGDMELLTTLISKNRASNRHSRMASQSKVSKASADAAGTAQIRRTRSARSRGARNVNMTDMGTQSSPREEHFSKQRELSKLLPGQSEHDQRPDSRNDDSSERLQPARRALPVPDTLSSHPRRSRTLPGDYDRRPPGANIGQLSTDVRVLEERVAALEEEKHQVRGLHWALEEIRQERLDMRMVQHNLEQLLQLQQQQKQQDMIELKCPRHSMPKLGWDNNQENLVLQDEVREARENLRKTTLDLEKTRKAWKNASSQLDQIKAARGSTSFQVTDDELITWVNGLRYGIRTFSMQYFAGESSLASVRLPIGGHLEYLREATGKSIREFTDTLRNGAKRVTLIQSLLWRLHMENIFGRFRWIPRLGDSMAVLYHALDPGK